MPSRMQVSFLEKVWGSTHLSPWFPDCDRKIGEAWYLHQPELPILVKLLFTSERLSVQVHPDDEYAAAHESSRGKTEMWHLLRADAGSPGVAAGLREPVSRERLRELAESGGIEEYLNWIEVKRGDSIFIPAGTIHAIGPGLVLCEIQQQSDVTYRLYDYGRPRELHLEQATAVSVAGPYETPGAAPEGFLASCPYFAVREYRVDGGLEFHPKPDRFELLIAIEGAGWIGGGPFRCGDAFHSEAGEPPFDVFAPDGARFLHIYVP